MRIGVDLMGGDIPPEELFPAVLMAANQLGERATLKILATRSYVESWSDSDREGLPSNVQFFVAGEVIGMEADPIQAVHKLPDSTIVNGARLLSTGHLDAFVSTGNTGALVVAAKLALSMLPGIRRPALLATLPTKKGPVAVIDVGGNVSCKAEHLVQFGLMGAAYQRCVHDLERPKVGLLNIGVESRKGTPEVRHAYERLKEVSVNAGTLFEFAGNVEGRAVFEGAVDVLVTDGFSGNVLLKTAEGVADFMFEKLSGNIPEMEPHFQKFQSQFDYAEYPGAVLCGIDAIVVKCHGHSSGRALHHGILGTATLVEGRFTDKIRQFLSVEST